MDRDREGDLLALQDDAARRGEGRIPTIPNRCSITVRPGHPSFLDLEWDRPVSEWTSPRLLDLPKGISRHEVRFLGFPEGIYAIKDMPVAVANREYEALRELEERNGPAVRPVGVVVRSLVEPDVAWSAALITRYLDYSFSYRELIYGGSFGPRRKQMLDAFAGLLVELHLLGCFWGDCSLNNALYRYDAGAIDVTLVDAETAALHESLSDGQRREDLEIMIENVAGGMADIAAEQGVSSDDADLSLGEDIARRYHALWAELSAVVTLRPDERYRITTRIERLNELGFEVEEVQLTTTERGDQVRMKVRVTGRSFHTRRLQALTAIEATDNQARQILSDLLHFEATQRMRTSADRALAAMRWRIRSFEPMLQRLAAVPGVLDPIQAFCDLLHHRYMLSSGTGYDVGSDAAFEVWLKQGRPGYPLSNG
jgi:hypothetical protein